MAQFAIVSSWILSHWLSYLINNGNEYSDNGMITSCDSLAPYKSKYKFIIGNHESSFLVAWSIESESTGNRQSIWRLDPSPFILSWDVELVSLISFASEFISSITSCIELQWKWYCSCPDSLDQSHPENPRNSILLRLSSQTHDHISNPCVKLHRTMYVSGLLSSTLNR